ncbi:MAG: protease modulator HflC [Desulfosalsimonadaceae bacterium]
MQANKLIIIVAVLIAIAAGAMSAVYKVDETEQVVITQFGRVVGEPITEPGLNFRIPVVQKVNFFPKNIQAWDGDPGQIPTGDKTYIWVDSFSRWRIVDPVAYLRTVSDRQSALSRLDDIINPAVRNVITSHQLIETVRTSNREMTALDHGDIDDEAVQQALEEIEREQRPTQYKVDVGREKMTRMMLEEAQPKLDHLGIQLIDIKIKRLNYVQEVRNSVYNRMIAERNQMAEKIRSMGQGEARKIDGDRERDLLEIQSEAYAVSEEIKGRADAEATRIYAEAYSLDPEFYSFMKSLDVYKSSLGGSQLVLSTDSRFLEYLNDFSVEGTE